MLISQRKRKKETTYSYIYCDNAMTYYLYTKVIHFTLKEKNVPGP